MFRKAYLRTLAAEVGLDPNEIAADYCARLEPPIEALAVTNGHTTVQAKWIEQLTPSPRRSIATLAALAAPAAAWFMLQPGPAAPQLPVHDRPRHVAAPRVIAAVNREAPLSITIQTTGWCWIAAETDGERVMYRLVEPGQRVLLEGQRMISLRLGDAGSVLLSINDGARRSYGRHGQVVELELTPRTVKRLRDGGIEAASEGLELPIELAPQ